MREVFFSFLASLQTQPLKDSLQKLITCVGEAESYSWLFNETESDGSYYYKACGGFVPFTQTTLNSYLSFPENSNLTEAFKEYSALCTAFTSLDPTADSLFSAWINGTQFLINSTNVNKSIPSTFPIRLSQERLLSSFQSLHQLYFNFTLAFRSGVLINGVVLFLAFFLFLTKRSKLKNKMVRYLKSKLVLPALFDTSHHAETKISRNLRTILPTRGEFLAVMLFVSINFIFTACSYPMLATHDQSKAYFFMRCIANRTGGLAMSLMPLTILTAGRNNLLLELTGLPFSSMIFFHKWIARMMTFQGSLHGLLWIGYGIFLDPSPVVSQFSEGYWNWGIGISLVSVGLVILSIYALRTSGYELFLAIHILLGVIFLYGTFKHCEQFGWVGWIYMASFLWVADRLLRLWHLLISFGGYRTATVELVSEYDSLLRLAITSREKESFEFFPGCYGYLYIMDRKLFWQSHPFTLYEHEGHFEILMKAKEGITQKLFSKITSKGVKIPLRVVLEGPYGKEAPLSDYSQVLIITSGAGIPGPVSYLEKVLTSPGRVSDLLFVWVVPNESVLLAMSGKLISVLMNRISSDMKFEICIYLTRSYEEEFSGSISKDVKIRHGRPNVEQIIDNFCQQENADAAVLSCCNPSLDDFVRKQVARNVLYTNRQLDFYDELQVW
ncbi:LAMI_0H19988g1_1 [Lachancea mirantina]|uniref:LAMI_0H19988g1_1 n=1 Tax=Lachancea mirantina TaxID=1230905 RepID=A0A1G4KJV6_9SACH|nr:LAMI_0H19988g1_1 [Lachancea mirantina]